jgi:hypothetical protein
LIILSIIFVVPVTLSAFGATATCVVLGNEEVTGIPTATTGVSLSERSEVFVRSISSILALIFTSSFVATVLLVLVPLGEKMEVRVEK